MPFDPSRLPDAYRQMHIIRKFEEAIRDLYQQGRIRGSFHPCVGQEAVSVGACWALSQDDGLSCTYRGHGHALAKGLDPRSAMAEMLGRATGCSKGKGGSMHFTDPSVGLIGANAIVAAGVPHAAGYALAMKMQGKDQVALTIFGEGAVNQGVFFETLNLAVVWKLPVIFLCENNLYSEMTPSYETTSNVATFERGASFGMPAVVVDGNDIEAVYLEVENAISRARSGGGPTYIEAMTYRLWGHMMGDPEIYRTKEEVAKARENEPIVRLGNRLLELGYTKNQLKDLENQAMKTIDEALSFAETSPAPTPDEALSDVISGNL
jgi:acetoin:2,6-dichlorophenolindophenol oxidoreductase subunit alpha